MLPHPLTSPATISHLLSSNAAPDGPESCIASGHLAELESQLATLDRFMKLCSRYRRELLRSIVSHKSIVSPVRRLPNELLAEIFNVVVRDDFYASARDDFYGRSRVRSGVEYPWIFTRVCRRWNAIALGTQSLWSWVFLNMDTIGGAVPATRLFYKRSGNLPLTVKIVERFGGKAPANVLNVALSHADRWQNLGLSLTAVSLPQVALGLDSVRGHLDALTTLEINVRMGVSDTTFKSMDSFTAAPNLAAVYLQIYDCYAAASLPPFPLPWQQLTRLSTTVSCNAEALALLPRLSRIVELRLLFQDPTDIVPFQNHVTLPHLRLLEVRRKYRRAHYSSLPDYAPSPSLLDFVTCPVLEHLTMRRVALVDTVLSCITRSECSGSLRLFHFDTDLKSLIDGTSALSLVHKMPRLSTLYIGHFRSGTAYSCTVRQLHSHWLAVRGNAGTSRLSVCLSEKGDVHLKDEDVSALLKLQQDGLFIKIQGHLGDPCGLAKVE
ncbi:hypothetical protein FB45DRAFT_1023068 [Roridomyces roridus]|uniref:F-box domain-containing protein n=1 Tax=Roridomyces roridus TaxID=1738132 RepID=A0AAD7FQS7_9AGAR|nr:hypothetical protein FB45DRAFT_1023068 [Roridomyces roridus]